MNTPTTTHDRAREQRTAWIVWGTLVTITVAGWLLMDDHGAGDAIVALIVLLGFGKCLLIIRYFMEVRVAPRWLQVVTTAWMATLWLTLLVVFLRT